MAIRRGGEVVAYNIVSGVNGNQAWGGVLGMDFAVPDYVAAAAFDSVCANGIQGTTITTQLSLRNRGLTLGLRRPITATTPNRDPGLGHFSRQRGELLAATGSGHPRRTHPGARTLIRSSPTATAPLSRTAIWRCGFTAGTTNSGGGSISFVDFACRGASIGGAAADNGPANRYGAGTFRFEPLVAGCAAKRHALDEGGFPVSRGDQRRDESQSRRWRRANDGLVC